MTLVPQTRAEAGCINYDLHQFTEDKSVFIFYENWVTLNDLDGHMEMPYLRVLKAKAADLLAEPLDITL